MKIEFNSNDELSLNKTIEIPSIKIVAKTVFYENNKYYLQVFLDECLYKLYTRKLSRTTKKKSIPKNIIRETKIFYILLAFLLITIVLLIAVSIYCYLNNIKQNKNTYYHFTSQITN